MHGRSPNGKVFVLVSDGQAWSGEVEKSLQLARSRDIPVFVVGVGTSWIETTTTTSRIGLSTPPASGGLDRPRVQYRGSLLAVPAGGGVSARHRRVVPSGTRRAGPELGCRRRHPGPNLGGDPVARPVTTINAELAERAEFLCGLRGFCVVRRDEDHRRGGRTSGRRPSIGGSAPLEADGASAADVSFEHLAVVPERLDDAVRPRLRQTERLAVPGHDTEQALDFDAVSLFFISSTFADVTPSRSASMSAKTVHRRMSKNCGSSARTSCASGSCEMRSGRMSQSPGAGMRARIAPSSDTSAVYTAHRLVGQCGGNVVELVRRLRDHLVQLEDCVRGSGRRR